MSSVPRSSSPSHTSTDQWQSFESRMRRRRADRCLRKAEVALRAGLIDDARRACADTREMDPTLPALAALEEDIAALPARRRHRTFAAAAACLTVLALTASLAWVHRSPPPHHHARAQADILLLAPAPTLLPSPRVEPAPVQPDPEPVTKRDAAVAPPERNEAVTPSAPARHESLDSAAAPRPAPLEPSPLPAFAATTSPPSPPPPEPESATLAVANAGDNDTAVEPPPDSAAIRRTLARYEAAYSDLDASAARSIWPTVDQRALARAFDDLASQRISLSACEVLVTGATARATCSGAATWTPKVGGGRQTQARRWAFELKNTAGSWQIVRADTR